MAEYSEMLRLTINSITKDYYRISEDNFGRPRWQSGTEVIRYDYNSDVWVADNEGDIIARSDLDTWEDITSPNLFLTSCSTSYSALEVFNAGIPQINGLYYPINFSAPIFGKTYNKWNKNQNGSSQYEISLTYFQTSLTKVYRWQIFGASIPYQYSLAYIKDSEVEFGEEPAGINCPPESDWIEYPGSSAGNAPTIAFRPCISCPNLSIAPYKPSL